MDIVVDMRDSVNCKDAVDVSVERQDQIGIPLVKSYISFTISDHGQSSIDQFFDDLAALHETDADQVTRPLTGVPAVKASVIAELKKLQPTVNLVILEGHVREHHLVIHVVPLLMEMASSTR